ncbi:RagB/SusD family nutrient uptake outer membrane protein [Flavilitoribacter nigricans DSM 23189 = NBRC 102662]|uniref:RagB/SusD family nutrient uptake outer membrane protein n=2 Tax=Flavilitoribacter TaxID=2762562 RepID=A0A2D0N2J1_FLAN2|nr:RagB/SusD family nutrient uptake outer membrane protein [Flavilitoribacter nigricans DSM 23189 = NBRC 102662]
MINTKDKLTNMKKLFFLILGLGTIFSCEDPFELTPTDIISENVVFEDEGLVNAYLHDLYNRTQFHMTSGGTNINMGFINSWGGEHRNFAPWQAAFGEVTNTPYDENGARLLDYWPYDNIRDINVLIGNLGRSTTLDPEFVTQKSAEARFIRAWEYFEMVKRFGGVPIVTEALDIDASESELFVSRNSEKEVYDFIGSELDAIAAILSESAEETGVASKWAALALKSRAMLYAASVARFGTEQLNGLLGFPSGDAVGYYQQSMAASREIMDNGPFSLYQKNPDKVQNLIDLFLDETGNPEAIFVEKYEFEAGKSHAFDITGTPAGFGFAWNSNYPVYLETMEKFDFIDGASGKMDPAMYDGETPFDPARFFGERDPRFRAWIFYPESTFKGQPVYFHTSTQYTDPADGTRKTTSKQSGFIIPGSDGFPGACHPRHAYAGGNNPTGLLRRKHINPATPDATASSTDWIIIRLAEILLNYAEAAFYLGDPNGDMADVFNQVRDRAGMPSLSVEEITEDKIRQERQVELAFEEHVFWDLRRWRIAVEELDNKPRHKTTWIKDYDTGMYYLNMEHGDKGRVRLHPERNYYYALGLGRIADNPNLVENPGY